MATSPGPVLDIGCGPGQLAAELGRRGVSALGIDVSTAAVALARARGVNAYLGDVFDPLPDERHWGATLLADGNIGIGGDPLALLRRCVQLLAPDGLVVADLSTRHDDVRRFRLRLEAVGAFGRVGGALPWASVGAGTADELGARVGLEVRSLRHLGPSAIVVWQRVEARRSP